jgi:hypothetical protein
MTDPNIFYVVSASSKRGLESDGYIDYDSHSGGYPYLAKTLMGAYRYDTQQKAVDAAERLLRSFDKEYKNVNVLQARLATSVMIHFPDVDTDYDKGLRDGKFRNSSKYPNNDEYMNGYIEGIKSSKGNLT